MPYSNLALDADRENGPAARSFAADAHDCIMVRINDPTAYKSVARKCAPNGELPSDPHRHTHPLEPEAMQKPHRSSSSLRVLRRQSLPRRRPGALRNTSPAKRQAAKLCYRFGPLTPSARSANLIAGDGTWRNRRASAAHQASR
jgi:hypothetical protein